MFSTNKVAQRAALMQLEMFTVNHCAFQLRNSRLTGENYAGKSWWWLWLRSRTKRARWKMRVIAKVADVVMSTRLDEIICMWSGSQTMGLQCDHLPMNNLWEKSGEWVLIFGHLNINSISRHCVHIVTHVGLITEWENFCFLGGETPNILIDISLFLLASCFIQSGWARRAFFELRGRIIYRHNALCLSMDSTRLWLQTRRI